MNRLLVVLVVGSLGCGGAQYIESSEGAPPRTTTSLTSTPPGPWSYCVQTCNRVREQLIRDFAVLPSSVDCLASDFQKATNCVSCSQVLERRYGVLPICE
ncbi:MAG: hypothetical protein JNM69_38630 [Archangium sp.]|nr:hypothetical protein [Archangium sp.]